jgi:hypothetical protein
MKDKDSKAQLEVWEWKEKISGELNKLPPEEWLAYITKQTSPIIKSLGLKKSTKHKLST